jgi:hypothetical protein
MNLNLTNVEKIVFQDKRVQRLLPHHGNLFGQWHLAQMSPSLRSLGKQAVLDFLNALNENDVEILKTYFQSEITLTKLNYNLVSNYTFSIDESEIILNEVEGFVDFATHRDENHIYISFWR